MIRRFGDPPVKGKTYKLRAGAYALLPRNDRILLTIQSSPIRDIQLPGGGIDPGESPICALHREVLEETGWRIAGPRRIGAFRRFVFMPEYDIWAEKVCLLYLARPTVRLGPPQEAGHSAFWQGTDRAFELLGNAGDRHFAELLARSIKRR